MDQDKPCAPAIVGAAAQGNKDIVRVMEGARAKRAENPMDRFNSPDPSKGRHAVGGDR